jgi:hypothetical protein
MGYLLLPATPKRRSVTLPVSLIASCNTVNVTSVSGLPRNLRNGSWAFMSLTGTPSMRHLIAIHGQ